MDPAKAEQRGQYIADRRVRELYRYYQPAGPTAIPSWLSAADDLPSSSLPPNIAPADDSGNSNSSATSRPSTALGPESLILGTSNNTLTSFAQLATLRLNAERAFIAVLDRDTQYILCEATKSVNLNDSSIHDPKDALWMGSTGSCEAWSLCQVGFCYKFSPEFHAQKPPAPVSLPVSGL